MIRRLLMDKIGCPECKGPWYVNLFAKWTPDGLAQHRLGSHDPPPSILIDLEQQRNVYQSLREAIGIDIDRIIAEAERKNIKSWVDSVLNRYPKFILNNSLAMRLVCRFLMFVRNYIPGYGWNKIISLNPSTHILYRHRDPYYLPLTVGASQGFFKAVFGGTSIATSVELAGGEYMIMCVRTRRPSGTEQRLEYVSRKRIPGSNKHKRCSKCNMPLKAMNYERYYDSGILYNIFTGLREIVLPNSGGDNIYRELTRELSEEVPRFFVEAERKFMSNRLKEYGLRISHSGLSELKEDNAENLQILLDDLPFRGMGNPVNSSLYDGVLELRVENPFNEARICGMVLGWYEALENGKGNLEWKVPDGEWAVEMKITPARSLPTG